MPDVHEGLRQFVYDFRKMKKEALLGKTSTSEGSSFTGERIYCGLVTKKRGTGSKPHYHPDETFNYVLEGALKVTDAVDLGEERDVLVDREVAREAEPL